MTIGLIRHFKVDAPVYKHPLTSEDFNETQHYYDNAEVFKHDVDLGNTDWHTCYASTMKRAQETAAHIYTGDIVSTDLLVEVDASAAFRTKRKRSFTFWVVLARLSWLFGLRSQKESRKKTKERCAQLYYELNKSGKDKVLVVTHGFFMKAFAVYLKKHGFEGKLDLAPKNAKLYLFTKGGTN
jgi:broad specificity phosphatase PhoE